MGQELLECSQRIRFLVWEYGMRDAARHCSTEQTKKAQNDYDAGVMLGWFWSSSEEKLHSPKSSTVMDGR